MQRWRDKGKREGVSASPDLPRTRTSVPGFGDPDKEACLSAPLQYLLQAAQWAICCQACLQKPQIPSLQGAEAGEASAYNKGNLLGGEGCQDCGPDQTSLGCTPTHKGLFSMGSP